MDQPSFAVSTFLPSAILAVAILTAGVLASLLAGLAVRRLESRSGGGGTMILGSRIRFDTIVSRIVLWGAVLLATAELAEALGLLGLRDWLFELLRQAPQAAGAMLIAAAALVLGDLASRSVNNWSAALGASDREQWGGLARVSIYGIAALLVLGQLGLEVTFLTSAVIILLAAVAGGVALALALGARSVVANMIALHYVRQLYDVGQRVHLDGVEGEIVRTTQTSVIVASEDGDVAVPASDFLDSRSTLIGGGSS